MAERSVLCIEPDGATVEEIRRALSRHGMTVQSIPNGDDAIEWGRAHIPVLIVLSVEPRKVGYAICNKLKRSPSLREVPLVLISAEETLATFEQHKKLKSHADEYLLKPLNMQDFLGKVERLVGLSGPGKDAAADDDDDEIHEIDADSDIVIADDDDIATVGSEEDRRLAGVVGADEEEGPETPAPVSQVAHDITSEQRVPPGDDGPPPPFE